MFSTAYVFNMIVDFLYYMKQMILLMGIDGHILFYRNLIDCFLLTLHINVCIYIILILFYEWIKMVIVVITFLLFIIFYE